MKTRNLLSGVALMATVIWGCQPYDMPPIIPQTGSSISSPAAGTSIVLEKDGADENSIDFTVTAADFGTTGTVRYILEVDAAGAQFAAPVALGESDSNIISVNVAELNEALLGKGLEFGVAGQADFRVKATINLPLNPIYGETLTLTVTPYDATVAFPVMYVPGDYQGWDPSNEATVLYSVNFDNKFKGYVHILGGSREFKVNETNSWDINYGDNGADGSLERDGSNLKVAADGTYELNVDLAAKTYTIGEVKRWGIVGSATAGGWDTDTPMDVFDKTTNSLKITTDLKAGEFKFRANNNWDNNFGGANGELTGGGPNIAIAADGNYTITLNFGAEAVTYTLTKN